MPVLFTILSDSLIPDYRKISCVLLGNRMPRLMNQFSGEYTQYTYMYRSCLSLCHHLHFNVQLNKITHKIGSELGLIHSIAY